ncbi:ATP-binding protein [Streptomyces fagopyri]|uniref:ATP-binding protein n=1 Tax=Streptomyces fagopyri TaxID=2662397 RepID=UPI0033EF2D63
MSTTQPYSPGDRGPESGDVGASGVSGDGVSVSGRPAAPTADGVSVTVSAGDAGVLSVGRSARRLSFEGESGVVPLARDFARQALHAWGWLPAAGADRRAAAEDVLLVVSELVTNACLHAEGPEELRISCDNKVLRVEVSDRGTGQPAPRTPHRAGRPGGHGMFIVQRLCLDWGVVRAPGVAGKTVWAELGAPA